MDDAASPKIDSQIWAALLLAQQWDLAQRRLAGAQTLRTAHGRLLWALRDGEPHTLKDIGQRVGLEQSTVSRQANAAIHAGLITRTRPAHAHADQLRSTPQGRALFEENYSMHRAAYENALHAIPEDSRDEFLTHLTHFIEAFGAAAEEASHG